MALAQNDKYACAEPNPQSLCNAGNTCGSDSTPCTVDVKRDDNGASATPGIPGAKGNSTFCVKTGTTIVWSSTQKNTGFVVDFGSSPPFSPDDAIVGGATSCVGHRNEGGLLQVFRWRMHFWGNSGDVRLCRRRGHYSRCRSLSITPGDPSLEIRLVAGPQTMELKWLPCKTTDMAFSRSVLMRDLNT